MQPKTIRHFTTAPTSVECMARILLIDTDPLDLETYAEVLEHYGHAVTPCESYGQALSLLQFHSFDLVVVEQGGAEFKARGVLEQLHAARVRIPSLVTARFRDLNCYLKSLSLGASEYLEKPVAPQKLQQAADFALTAQVLPAGC